MRGGRASPDAGPAIVAYAEVQRLKQRADKTPAPIDTDPNRLEMLSIGTGTRTYSFTPPGDNAGLASWNTRLFEVPSAAQSQGATFQAQYLLGERFVRIDYELPYKSWALDAVEATDQLVHLGREVAAAQLRRGVERFFEKPSGPYRKAVTGHAHQSRSGPERLVK